MTASPLAPPKLHSLLLDRDGTVIKEKHYLCDPEGVELIAGAGEVLAEAVSRGVALYLVSNQSGIGRGYYSEPACLEVNARMEEMLAGFGARLTGSVFCPHTPEADCCCRKPGTGMWEELAGKYGLDPETSAMIGDKAADVGFGRAAGLARVVLVLTGHGQQNAKDLDLPLPRRGWAVIDNPAPNQPHIVAVDLPAALTALGPLLPDWGP